MDGAPIAVFWRMASSEWLLTAWRMRLGNRMPSREAMILNLGACRVHTGTVGVGCLIVPPKSPISYLNSQQSDSRIKQQVRQIEVVVVLGLLPPLVVCSRHGLSGYGSRPSQLRRAATSRAIADPFDDKLGWRVLR
jgi:hypothetical protein